MALLTREQLLAPQLPSVTLAVPELGGEVRVQQMSLATREAYFDVLQDNQTAIARHEEDEAEGKLKEGASKPQAIDPAHLGILVSLVDEQGNRLFRDDEVEVVRGWPYPLLGRLWNEVLSVNKLMSSDPQLIETEKKD